MIDSIFESIQICHLDFIIHLKEKNTETNILLCTINIGDAKVRSLSLSL